MPLCRDRTGDGKRRVFSELLQRRRRKRHARGGRRGVLRRVISLGSPGQDDEMVIYLLKEREKRKDRDHG